MKTITEKTLVPLGFIVVVVGCVFWLTSLYNRADATAEAVKGMEEKQFRYEVMVLEIRERLIRIESKIERRK